MACKVHKIYAPNGEPSKLFADLVTSIKDENSALELWASTRTPGFKAFFGDWQDADFKGNLDVNGEPLAKDILDAEYVEDVKVMEEAKKSSVNFTEASNRMAETITKTRDVLIRRIKELENNPGEGAKNIMDKLSKLKKNLKTLDWREATVEFSAAAKQNIEFARKRIITELDKPTPNNKVLHRMHGMLTAFDVLGEMRNEIDANPLMRESMEAEIKVLDELIGQKNGAQKMYAKYMSARVVTEIAKQSKGKLTEEQIREHLNKAPKDLTSAERWLRYAGDSSDPIIALVAKMIDTQQQKTRETSIEFTRNLGDKLTAMEAERSQHKGNAEKMFDPMLERNSKGNLTGHIVHPKHSKPQYEAFREKYKGTATFEFYEHFLNEYERLNKLLPPSAQMEHRLPTLLKSTLERVLTSENKLEQAKQYAANKIQATNTDVERGQMLDDSSRAVNTLPIHFTQVYDSAVYQSKYRELLKAGVAESDAAKEATEYARAKLPETISYDLGASLQAFQYMAESYANMNEIIDVVEGAKDMMYNRKVTVTDARGIPFVSKLKTKDGDTLHDNTETIAGAESNAYKMLEALIQMQVYGQTEQDLGNFSIGNMQIDKRKLVKLLSSSNSTLMMGLNLTASTVNIANGEVMRFAEMAGGEYFTSKEYFAADAEYYRNMTSMIADASERTPQNKINLINEKFNILGDYHPDGVGATDASKLRRASKSGSIFMFNSIGEHMMQSKVAIAMFMNTKTFDSTGKETGNLYSAYKAKDGKLSLATDTYIKLESGEIVKFNQEQQFTLTRKIQTMMRFMYGNYNSQTAAAWQQNALYGLIGQFRKWIYPGFQRRFGKANENYFAEKELEGNYRSTAKLMGMILKDLGQPLEITAKWDKMTPHQRANVRRTITELGWVIMASASAATLAFMIKDLDDEEDKEILAAMRFGQYVTNRLSTELLFFADPTFSSAWTILKSPMASMTMIQRIGDVINYALPWNWDERYEAGVHKDKSKLLRSATKLVPLYSNIEKVTPQGIKSQLEIFNMN